MARDLIKSDLTISTIKPGDKRKRLNDGAGLYLLLFVKGGSHGWRLDYTFQAKRKTISLGTYPDTGLKLAREKRNDARKKVADGTDPSEARKAEHQGHVAKKVAKVREAAGLPDAGTFEAVFRDWLATQRSGWGKDYAARVESRIVRDIPPATRYRPIASITRKELLDCLREVQARGAVKAAVGMVGNLAGIFRLAIAHEFRDTDPTTGLSESLDKGTVTHMGATIKPADFGALMVAVSGYVGAPATTTALKIAALTFQRPGNVRSMRWADLELDGDRPMWTIPSAAMKRRVQAKIDGKPHLVPLSPQAVKLLRDLQPLTGRGAYVFPNVVTGERHMSENTMNVALRRLGFSREEATSHGFRASARTILCEQLDVDPEVVEAQLAHAKSGPLGGAYDRAEYLARRRVVMNLWADCIDALRDGKTIEQFRAEPEEVAA